MRNKLNPYNQLITNYEGLIPNQTEILVIFLLYQKTQMSIINSPFSYDTVVNCIDEVDDDLARGSGTNHNLLIRRLQKFFLRRNNQGYSLKEYANDFCVLLETEISNRISPAELELKFKTLAQSLKENITDESRFNIWYKDYFTKSKLTIRKQIDILHNKLELAINKLNLYYSSSDLGFTEKLSEMDGTMQEIQGNTHQLTKAFDAKEEIRELLDQAKSDNECFAHDSDLFLKSRVQILNFLDNSDQALSSISNTIDSIIPQMDRLFDSLEHRDFDRKIENMLVKVFSESKRVRNDAKAYEIKLPDFLPSHVPLGIKKSKLVYCVDYHFLNIHENEPLNANIDPKEEEENYNKSLKKLLVNKKVNMYSSNLVSLLRSGQNISLSNQFNQIAEEEDLEIAFKSIFLTLKVISKDGETVIDVEKTIDFNHSKPNLATWKMEIITNLHS